jgi:UDP-N-acetyl-2-amino-2-deoxyglucuronate dehydrogenase
MITSGATVVSNNGDPMTMHIGLIGGGNISETHARAISAIAGAQIAAIYGTSKEKIERLSREYGGRGYDDFQAFLDHRPMDLVVIGSPSGLHASHGIATAQRSLHVLTEKPIDISVRRADELIEGADRAGVKLGVIFQDRGKEDIRRLKKLIDGGGIGRPLLAEAKVKWYRPAEYYGQSKWRGTLAMDGGGALINQGIHTIDVLLWLMGDVTGVQARTSTALHSIEGEDTALALLEFANGAVGSLQATTAAFPGYPRRIEITGTEGTVILEQDQIVAIDVRNPMADTDVIAPSHDRENNSSPVVSDFRSHQVVIEDFLTAIRENGPPICDGREGRRSLALVERIYEAAKAVG